MLDCYEPSRILLWCIYQTLGFESFNKLLLIIKYVKSKKRKANKFFKVLDFEFESVNFKTVNITKYIIPSALKVNTDISYKPKQIYASFISNLYYKLLNDEPLTFEENVFTTQLNTTQAFRFLSSFDSLVPEQLLPSRDSINDAHKYKYTLYESYLNYTFQNLDCRIKRNVRCPPNKIINLDKYNRCVGDVYQPLYCGMRVVISSFSNVSRIYSIDGIFLNINPRLVNMPHTTFEAIILPMINSKPKHWRCWPFKTSLMIFIVDVFMWNNKLLYNDTYKNRIGYIDEILKENNNLHLVKSQFETDYTKIKTTSYSEGFIIRNLNKTFNPPIAHLAIEKPYTICFNLFSGEYENVSIINNIHQHVFSFKLASFKEVVFVYSQNAKYLFCCKFDSSIFKFIHCGEIPNIYNEDLKYQKKEQTYIYGNQNPIYGQALLNVYFDIDNNVIGYAQKKTTTFYNLPLQSRLFKNTSLIKLTNLI